MMDRIADCFEELPGHWKDRVNQAMTEKQVDTIRRGSPFGAPDWPQTTARRLNLDSTLRPRVSPMKAIPKTNNESDIFSSIKTLP